MQDSDTIIVQNNNLNNVINVVNLNDFEDLGAYNLDDEKDYNKFVKDIERIVRSSFEYKVFCRYLRENFGMDRCAFLNNVSKEESPDVKIHLHHYPYSLFDIVNIIYRKRYYNRESLSVFMIAEEVIRLHYQLLVGLVPLSETVHQLAHAGRLFIPVNKVLGRYKLFTDIYYPFIEPDMIDTLKRIEKATYENSEVGDTTILNTNNIKYNVSDKRYQMPKIPAISDQMINQIQMIKDNNYILPTVNEVKQIEAHTKNIRCPIKFIKSVE